MYLEEIFEKYSKEELKDIARIKTIRGFSKKKKNELIELLCQNIFNDHIIISDLYENCPKSQKYFLKILAEKRNGMGNFEKIKSQFLNKYSKSTFFSSYGELEEIFFIFLIYNSDFEELLVIPSEILSEIRKKTKKEIFDLEPVLVQEEAQKILSVSDILKKINKNDLKNFCEKKGFLQGGNKEELISRIMELKDPNNILKAAKIPVLRWACEELDCGLTGSKQEIRDRILIKLDSDYKPKAKPKLEKITIAEINELENNLEDVDDEKYDVDLMRKVRFDNRKLIERIREILETIPLDVKGLKNEQSLESSLYTVLKINDKLKDVKITRGSASKRENKLSPDIFIEKENEKFCIEAKFIDQRHPTTTIDELKVQMIDFQSDYSDFELFIFLYDKAGKMESQNRIRIKKQVKNYIYRTQDDFEGDD
jgi:hypothetical protein